MRVSGRLGPIGHFGQRAICSRELFGCEILARRPLTTQDKRTEVIAMSASPILFYDNRPAPRPPTDSYIAVERVYAIDFGRLSTADEVALLDLYRRLPGGYREHEVSYWFGDSDDVPPVLSASAEPSGLMISGTLSPADWSAWHDALVVGLLARPFPLHDFGTAD